ncbi:MAG: family 16 glycoside hydrolase, partial [bacterium]
AEKLVKKTDWNDFRIEAKGKHVRIFINGTKVIDRKDDKFDNSGIIALQVHVGPAMEVSYKDIEIKELS